MQRNPPTALVGFSDWGEKCQPRMNQSPLSCGNCLDLKPRTETLSQHEEMNVSTRLTELLPNCGELAYMVTGDSS